MKPVLFITLLLSSAMSWAQRAEQPAHPKKIYVDSTGRYYQQASLPVYLMIMNSEDGKATPLKPVSRKEVLLEGHGVHTFKHENFMTKGFDEFEIYADGIAPVTAVQFSNAPAFASATRQFYGPGLSVSLSAKDEMSGLEQVFHSINGKPFENYAKASFSSEGTYEYRFYATDRTGNAEAVKTKVFTVDVTPPVSYHNFIGISSQNVISTNSSIYLTVSDTLSGIAKTFYKFDKENFRVYPGGNIPFQYLVDGDHVLTYYSIDNVTNKESEKSMKFYLDKTAPIMSADVLGDKFIVGERVYFSGRTKLKLTAVDNKSGIKDLMYSVNDQEYVKYADPFYLPNRSGIHSVKFYAVDQTNNKINDDFQHSVGVIYVDLTGPSINHAFGGTTFVKADTVFVSPKTTILLSGSDAEAGLKKITYNFDESNDELPYSGKPVAISLLGLHKLNYYAYDNVNNKNSKSTIFIVDNKGPEITYQFAVSPKDGKYPSYTSVYLAAMDAEVGTSQISYKINGGKEQLYIAPIKGFVKNKEYTIQVTATDLLGNATSMEFKFKTDRY